MSGLKDVILEADDRPSEDVEVEEWGTTVRLRGLSGAAAEQFSRTVQEAGEEIPENMMAELLVRCIEDPNTGDLVFGEDDIGALANKSAKVLTVLFRRAQELSGLGDLEEAKN